MSAFVLLLVCLLLGLLIAHFGKPPEGLARSLNWWVLNIALPALVLELIPQLQFAASLWFLAASMWLVFVGAWLVFHLLGTRLNWSRTTIGTMVLVSGLGNTSFVGLALIEALRGKQALPYAAVADQLGSFLCVSIGSSIVIAMYTGGAVSARIIVRKIISFPPFIALLVAGLMMLGPGLPPFVETVLARISATLVPLALFTVGLQLRLKFTAHNTPLLLLGLLWKLGVAPLMILGVGLTLHISQPILGVTLLQAAMASMVMASILVEQSNMDSQLANMLVGVSILLSFITVPLWNLLL